jgi:hypothetical protein
LIAPFSQEDAMLMDPRRWNKSLERLEQSRKEQQQKEQEMLLHANDWARIMEKTASFDAGPLLYLTTFTKTEDHHWSEKGTQPVAPFPKKEYLRVVLQEVIADWQVLFLEKSRQMMASWLVCGYITWMCQTRPQIFWIIQSKDENTSAALVEYCRCLCRHQADWISRRNALVRNSRLELRWQNGSRVLGLPSSVNKVRVHHPYGYFADEAAFMPRFKECFGAIKPVAKKIIAVSSAGPSWFADECGSFSSDEALF